MIGRSDNDDVVFGFGMGAGDIPPGAVRISAFQGRMALL